MDCVSSEDREIWNVDADEERQYIDIPIRNSTETVQIFLDELPASIDDLLDVLKAEAAPLDLWLRFAVEYYHQGRLEQFHDVLREIISSLNSETEIYYAHDPEGFRTGRLRILNALASDAVNRSVATVDQTEKQTSLTKALEYFESADRLESSCILTWVGKGNYYLVSGDYDQARYYFKNARKQSKNKNIPASLGEACILFHEGNYKKALNLYCEVIQLNPRCSAGVRVGLGLCCYKLQQYTRAHMAFERALELDPKCTEALVGAAIMEMNMRSKDEAHNRATTEEAIKKISLAYHLDSLNAMALNHLANHYFWAWIPVKKIMVNVEEGARQAQCSASLEGRDLAPGDLVRIGKNFITTIDINRNLLGTTLPLANTYDFPTGTSLPLYMKDFRKAFNLAKEASKCTQVPEMRAESNYIMGRVHHAQGRYSDAHFYYNEACKLWKGLAPAQYGRAQLLLHEGKKDEALECLDLVLKELPDREEALLLQGLLYSDKNDRENALSKLKAALDINSTLCEAWITQAQIFQQDTADYGLALSSYTKALALLSKSPPNSLKQDDVAFRTTKMKLLVNTAVLYDHFEKFSEAKKAYEKAMMCSEAAEAPEAVRKMSIRASITDPTNYLFWEWDKVEGITATVDESAFLIRLSGGSTTAPSLQVGEVIRIGNTFVTSIAEIPPACDDSSNPNEEKCSIIIPKDLCLSGLELPLTGPLYRKIKRLPLTKDVITISYNLALLHERMGDYDAAIELHKAILDVHPTYVDCYLCLGYLVRDSRHNNEANQWFQHARAIEPQNADISAHIANLGMRVGEWGPAQKMFEKILEMPNTNRKDSYSLVSLGNIYFSNLEDRGKYEKHISYASNFYQQVAAVDPSNAYAANGLGMAMAEKGELEDAKDVFARVREVSSGVFGDVWVNLAHVYLGQGKYIEATRMYQNCLKKFHGGREVDLYLYLAQAYFDSGQHSECGQALLKSLHIFPGRLQLWYNLAITQETFAITVLQKDQIGETRTVSDVQHAIDDLSTASKLFKWLSAVTKENAGRKSTYPLEKATRHATFCESNISSARQHLQHEKMKEQERRQEKFRRLQKLEEMEKKKQEVQIEARRLVEEGLADRESRAKAVEERQKALKQSWALKGAKLKSERGVGRPAVSGRGGRRRGRKGKGHRNSRADEDEDEESSTQSDLSELEEDEVEIPDRYSVSTPGILNKMSMKDMGFGSDDSSDESDINEDAGNRNDGSGTGDKVESEVVEKNETGESTLSLEKDENANKKQPNAAPEEEHIAITPDGKVEMDAPQQQSVPAVDNEVEMNQGNDDSTPSVTNPKKRRRVIEDDDDG